jgi:hypothetical protein
MVVGTAERKRVKQTAATGIRASMAETAARPTQQRQPVAAQEQKKRAAAPAPGVLALVFVLAPLQYITHKVERVCVIMTILLKITATEY